MRHSVFGADLRFTPRLLAMTIVAIGIALALPAAPAAAKDKPFYEGKTVRLVISAGAAGGYMQYARLLVEHLGKHLAGHPSFIVQSMPGAGGVVATNYLFKQAPQDGTTFGLIHAAMPLAPLFGTTGARFDAQKFHWIGSLDRSNGLCTVWHTAPIKTWNDMLTKEFVVGSSGAGIDIYPKMLNELFGTKIKIVGGYKSGAEIFLAMERGEVEGRCSPQYTSMLSLHPTWFAEKKVLVPVVIAEKRSPNFPDSPSIMEFVKDDNAREQIRLLIVSQDMDRPFLLPPGVPDARVQEMRAAFLATTKDPAFIADAEKQRLHLDPVAGDDLTKALAHAYALPQSVVDSAKNLMVEK